MSVLGAANAYFDAWNARDAKALLQSLGGSGTYEDPITRGPISGDALQEYAETLWSAFPDLNFEIKSVAEIGEGRVAAEWIMRGTNEGSFRGLPPTGGTVESDGADFLETNGEVVTSVVGYFDGGAIPRQLGLQIIVQPNEIGPFRFGISTAVQTGSLEKPTVFGVTQVHAIDEDAVLKIREFSRQIMTEMMDVSGFLGATTAGIGLRMVTLSAWTDEDALTTFMRGGTHAEAMKELFKGSVGSSGYTSVWSPVRVNPYWVRCTSCGTVLDSEKSGSTCKCGAELPGHPPYW
jgi:steroid delta-isomerase-like uncharacterized protein